MWRKLITAKVSRINDVLRISSSPIVGVLAFGSMLLAIFITLIVIDYQGIARYAGAIIPTSMILLFIIYQYFDAINSRGMTISKRFGIDILMGDGRDIENLKIKTPSFIKLTVKPKKRTIKVTIGTKRRTIAQYRLQSKTDLTRLVDGIMEILNMELESTEQEGKVDVLTFIPKSKK